jgi:hypothetical protein
MEIVGIEGKTFLRMKERFEEFTRRVRELTDKRRISDEWMNNGDVCRMLNVSKRTLQTYRDKGILHYSQIEHKCYYRVEDIKRLLEQSTDSVDLSRRL